MASTWSENDREGQIISIHLIHVRGGFIYEVDIDWAMGLSCVANTYHSQIIKVKNQTKACFHGISGSFLSFTKACFHGISGSFLSSTKACILAHKILYLFFFIIIFYSFCDAT